MFSEMRTPSSATFAHFTVFFLIVCAFHDASSADLCLEYELDKDTGKHNDSISSQKTTTSQDPRRVCADDKVLSLSNHSVKSDSVKVQTIKVGVPKHALFPSFVTVNSNETVEEKRYTGFSIELFKMLMKEFPDTRYEFQVFNGSYNRLVCCLHYKTWDAIVGDITILSQRSSSSNVFFTPKYMDSSLSLIALAVPENPVWMFVKPFTRNMWLVTGMVLVYIMFAVWFMERRESPDFSGSWANQIGTAISFTLASLFFVQREKLNNLMTRVVIIVWLFTVLIVGSSYTASLSSMLTVQTLSPTVKDIKWLAGHNKTVGCDKGSFLCLYLKGHPDYKGLRIFNITDYHDYKNILENGSVSAIVLETPYQKAFFNQFSSKKFAGAAYHSITFGGLAFGFANRTPLFDRVSKIILELKENGTMKKLEEKWFSPAPTNADDDDDDDAQLGLKNFIVLLALPVLIATISMLVVIIQRVRKFIQRLKLKKERRLGRPRTDHSVQDKARKLVSFVCVGETDSRSEASSSIDSSGELQHRR